MQKRKSSERGKLYKKKKKIKRITIKCYWAAERTLYFCSPDLKKKKKNCLFGANPNTYHTIVVFIAPAVFIFKVLHKYIGYFDYSNNVVQKVPVYPFYFISLYNNHFIHFIFF